MIIVKIIGGLGNQMFQYAMGFSLAKINNSTCRLDLSGFTSYKLHNYSLKYFNIHLEQATKQEINIFKSTPDNFRAKVLYKLGLLNRDWQFSQYISERAFNFDQSILGLRGNYYLDGYWQSEKYFMKYRDQLRDEFKIKTTPDHVNMSALSAIANSESVSVHIRHGDYLTNHDASAIHGVLPLDYYKRAFSLIRTRLHDPTFFVFSDNIVWAKQNLSNIQSIYFMEHNKAEHNYEDLRLMSACKHNIIANSSFSWWAAWLNNNPHKLVIAPQKWFTDRTKDTKDLLPIDWIKL